MGNANSSNKAAISKEIKNADNGSVSSQLSVATYYLTLIQTNKDDDKVQLYQDKAASYLRKAYDKDRNNLWTYVLYAELNLVQKKNLQATGWFNDILKHSNKDDKIPPIHSFDAKGMPFTKKSNYNSFKDLAEFELQNLNKSNSKSSIPPAPKGAIPSTPTNHLSATSWEESTRRNSGAIVDITADVTFDASNKI